MVVCVVLSSLTAHAQFRKSRDKNPAVVGKAEDLNYANPQEYFIGGIEVTGLTILDKNAMVSLTGLKVGDKIKVPGDAIANAIRKLWKHGIGNGITRDFYFISDL